MNDLRTELAAWLARGVDAVLPATAGERPAPLVERAKQAADGDYATNVALALAKQARRSPRDLAQAIVAALPASPLVERVEIAGAGFVNVFLTRAARQAIVRRVLRPSRWPSIGRAAASTDVSRQSLARWRANTSSISSRMKRPPLPWARLIEFVLKFSWF